MCSLCAWLLLFAYGVCFLVLLFVFILFGLVFGVLFLFFFLFLFGGCIWFGLELYLKKKKELQLDGYGGGELGQAGKKNMTKV